MEQNRITPSPEAATDEPASSSNPAPAEPAPAAAADQADDPQFASEAEETAFWKGVTHGIRCTATPERPHLPADFEPGLVSARLTDAYAPVISDVRGRAIRHDGFTPDKQVAYLSALSICGVVADACRQAGVGRDTVYDLRNSAAGRAFALAWDAAILISRGRMADELMSRAMNGCVDRIYKNGECVAERHRHDNRLAMAVLTRLDRQAEGMGEGAAVARTIGQDWQRFLEIVRDGGGQAGTFLAARAKQEPQPESAEKIGSAAELLARLKVFQLHEAGQAERIATDDLDPRAMDRWTEDQWLRAGLSGFLAALPEEEWPEYASDELEAVVNGSRRSRRVYLDHHPESAEPERDPHSIWEDEDQECWMTDYPPPEGFAGFEEGEWGEEDYRRALSPAEQAAVEADVAADEAEEAAERAEELAAACAARDRAFGFAGDE